MGVDGIEDGFGQLVQESGRQTGWRDAPGEERQSVTFRHEGAYRRRAQSGLVHTMIGTAANVSDVTQAQALLHGDETDAFGDAGYQGVEKRAENQELLVTWHVAMRPSKCKALPETPLGDLLERIYSYTMLTINADQHPLMRQFHKPDDEKRSVVILNEHDYDHWLHASSADSREFLYPYPADNLVAATPQQTLL